MTTYEAPALSAGDCLLSVAEGWARDQGAATQDGGRRYDIELQKAYLLAVVWQPSNTYRYDVWAEGRYMRAKDGDLTPWLTLDRDEAVQLLEGYLQ